MVHALRRVADRLSSGGVLISIRPHRTWRPSLAIVAGSRRIQVTELLITPFASNLASAEAALERVVREGAFTPLGNRGARWRTYLERPSQMRTYLELIVPPRPRFPKGARTQLRQRWQAMSPGARIEITEPLVMTVLRKRGGG